MGRSLKKGPYVHPKLLAKVDRQQRTGSREPIKTWARDCTIVPDFIGFTFLVHNGRQFRRCSSRKTWSATSSENSPRRACSRDTRAARGRSDGFPACGLAAGRSSRWLGNYLQCEMNDPGVEQW